MNTRIFTCKQETSGLSKKMNIILLDKNSIIYNKPLEEAKTIFINTRQPQTIIMFINKILHLIKHSFNLIIAGSDYTFPNNIDKRKKEKKITKYNLKKLINNKYINKIFVENLDTKLPKVYPIPLGINPKECSTKLSYFKEFYNIDIKKPLKFTNFNRTRSGKGQWEERGEVLKMCNTVWKNNYIKTKTSDHKTYLKNMGRYSFTICVHGGGLDVNPKLWEALLIGVIPIIKENKPYTDIYIEHDLPVVIVKRWSKNTITFKKLLKWKNKYYNYFTDEEKRNKILEFLTLDYWVNYVS